MDVSVNLIQPWLVLRMLKRAYLNTSTSISVSARVILMAVKQ